MKKKKKPEGHVIAVMSSPTSATRSALRAAGELINGDHETDTSEFCSYKPGTLFRMISGWYFNPLGTEADDPLNPVAGDILMYLGVLPLIPFEGFGFELRGGSPPTFVEYSRQHAWLSRGKVIYFNSFCHRKGLSQLKPTIALDNIFEIVWKPEDE